MITRSRVHLLLPTLVTLWLAPPPAAADAGAPAKTEDVSPPPAEEPAANTPAPTETAPPPDAADPAAIDEGPGIPLLPILGGLLALGLLAGLVMLALARRTLRTSRENASTVAQGDSSVSRRGTGRELDDVRRDLEAIREVLRSADRGDDVGRCREIERAVGALQDEVRRLPAMGGPSATKVEDSRGMAAVDGAVRDRAAALLLASGRLRERAEAGAGPELRGELDAFARQVRQAGAPHKERPEPVQG